MEELIISIKGLSKVYRVPIREEGVLESIKSLFKRSYTEIQAVENISFSIKTGEVVGFIGPNGAGKTTTLKMMSGLLHPTTGDARIAGYVPWERKDQFLQSITMVLGNKSQMLWDIPPMETFRVLGEIYRVDPLEFKKTLDELIDLLEMKDLLNKPVRNLSLGERMKCELAASLLHRPKVLFLDEPTLGLDVSMQNRVRQFLKRYNQKTEATIILTSHYMADVTALCPRVILIHHGKLIYDGDLNKLSEKLLPFKIIRFSLTNGGLEINLPQGVDELPREEDHIVWRTDRKNAASITAKLLSYGSIADLTVEDPPIEAVIDQIYTGGEA